MPTSIPRYRQTQIIRNQQLHMTRPNTLSLPQHNLCTVLTAVAQALIIVHTEVVPILNARMSREEEIIEYLQG